MDDFPNPQAVHSRTFRRPPLDCSLILPLVIELQAKQSAEHRLFRFVTPENVGDEPGKVVDVSWGEAIHYFHRAAHLIQDQLGREVVASRPVVGILASSASALYWVALVAMFRLGCVPFAISPRNSPEAIAHLLKATETRYLFVSPDQYMQNVVVKTIGLLRDSLAISVYDLPTVDNVFGDNVNVSNDSLPSLSHIGGDDIALIVHSSGSTSFPKPIRMTHRVLFLYLRSPYYGQLDLCDRIICGQSFGMFHMLGINLIGWTAFTGCTVALFPPIEPPTLPTAERLLSAALYSNCSIFVAPSAFLETWANESKTWSLLSKFEIVAFGGGPLRESAGNALVDKGIKLINVYGLTEVGMVSHIFPSRVLGKDWNYFEIAPNNRPIFYPVDGDEEILRLVMLQSEVSELSVPNMTINGTPAYDTNDLLTQHPSLPSLYRITGRFGDDQIMHSSGEKTNPGPIEAILLKDDKIKYAMMFGRSKFNAGVLIVPNEEFDPSDEIRLATFLGHIWPTVIQANAFAPQHSKILKEMILISHPSKPFEFTPKGTLRRSVTISLYEQEIERLYKTLETDHGQDESQLNGEINPRKVSIAQISSLVRSVVQEKVSSDVKDEEDIFRVGADSLSASRIRSALLRGLPELHTLRLPTDFVFAFPTIAKMTALLYGISLASGPGQNFNSVDLNRNPLPDLEEVKETIVQMIEPVGGEPPFIIFHGGSGTSLALLSMAPLFKTGLWAIRITPDTRLTDFVALTDYYFGQIKEAQPQGPYRLCGYSASALIVTRVTKLLESNGDVVEQLVYMDHFPTAFLRLLTHHPSLTSPLPPIDLHGQSSREGFLKAQIQTMRDLFLQDPRPHRQRSGAEIWNAFNGIEENVSEIMRNMNLMSQKLLLMSIEFAIALCPPNTTNRLEINAALDNWMSDVKAPVTVYIAKHGIFSETVDHLVGEPMEGGWRDPGIFSAYPHARVVCVDTYHVAILEHEEVCTDLQKKYL